MSETKEKLKPTSEKSLTLAARVEALLFVAPSSTSVKQMADSLGVSTEDHHRDRRTAGNSFSTWHPSAGEQRPIPADHRPRAFRRGGIFLQLESTARFTAASLETLAIVAYQQPITRPGVDAIRGVNSDSVIRNLLSKGLIEETGRSDGPGRPILYGTSPEFLQYFGLSSIKDLPEIDIKRAVFLSPQEEDATQQELPLLKE